MVIKVWKRTSLNPRLADLKNLVSALRKVISNKGNSGIDEMSVQELKEWFSAHYQELQYHLKADTYQVTAVKEVLIPKPKDGHRQLGVLTKYCIGLVNTCLMLRIGLLI